MILGVILITAQAAYAPAIPNTRPMIPPIKHKITDSVKNCKVITLQFLTESVILCLIGGIIGLVLGIAGAYAACAVINITPKITWWVILLALAFSSGVGLFFGIYPARKAAKLSPIEALRRE